MNIDAVYKGVSRPRDASPVKMHFKSEDGEYFSFLGYVPGHNKGDLAVIETESTSALTVTWVK